MKPLWHRTETRAQVRGESLWPVDVNPFTCQPWHLSRFECGCDPRAYHAEECWTTPIYAALVEEIDSVWGMLRDLQMADLFTHEQVKQWWNRLGSNEDPS